MVWLVVIGRLEQGSARTQCTVEIELDAAEPQPVIVKPWRWRGTGNQLHRFRAVGIGHDAKLQRAAVASPAIGLPVLDCGRSEEHTSELQSLMRISYAVFCLKKKKK